MAKNKNESIGEWVDISKLKEWDKNPRNNQNAIEEVAKSIKRFGFASPIIARKEDGTIIAGHTRFKASKLLKLEKVPVRYMDLDPADSKLLALADNKVGEIAEWNDDLLKSVLQEMKNDEIDLSDIGFSDDQLNDLLQTTIDNDFEIDNDVDDLINEEIIHSKEGGIYKLGKHILICGDSTKQEYYPDEKDVILFTSPPYGIIQKGMFENKSKYIEKEKINDEYKDLLFEFTKQSLKKCNQLFINIQMLADNKKILIEYLHEYKNELCDILIWDKSPTEPAMAENVCNSSFEFIFVLSKNNNKRRMQFSEFRGTISNVLKFPKNTSKEFSSIHKAVMSSQFCEYMITTFAKKSNLIIDCFGGTGTTLLCCEKYNKRSYLIEKNPLYCDVIRRRWTKYAIENNIEIGSGALQ